MQSPSTTAPTETLFIGRQAELKTIDLTLARTPRLLTLHGCAGIGKTSLARRFALTTHDRWEGGAWVCDLANARSLSGTFTAIAQTLGIPLIEGQTTDDVADRLARALGALGTTLLVLDAGHNLVQHAHYTIDRWTRAAPELVMLVTCVDPLGVTGEVTLQVPSLASADAAALLIGAAQHRRPDFSPKGRDLVAVAEAGRRLRGIPLALELVAGTIADVQPAEVLATLARDFALDDTRPLRDTLDHVIDWVAADLPDWALEALAQCAVFAGGIAPPVGAAVIDLSRHPDAPSPAEALLWLEHRALLSRMTLPESPGSVRYALHAAIRDKADATLDALGTRGAIEARFAEALVDYAAPLAQGAYVRAGDASWWSLARELDNLVAVHRRPGTPVELATRAVLCFDPILQATGPGSAREAFLSTAARAVADVPALKVGVWRALASSHRGRGRVRQATRFLDGALEAAEAVGATHDEAEILADLGSLALAEGDHGRADILFRRGLALHRQIGDSAGEGRLLGTLANLRAAQGDAAGAEQLYERALGLHRAAGNVRSEAAVLGALAVATLEQGRLDEAETYASQALELYRYFGDRRLEGVFLGLLGDVHLERGRLSLAMDAYNAGLQRLDEVDGVRDQARILAHLGVLAVFAGRLGEAWARLGDAYRCAEEGEDSLRQGYLRIHLGVVAAMGLAIDGAQDELARGEQLVREAGDPFADVALELARSVLDVARMRQAEERGDEEEAEALRQRAAARIREVTTPADDAPSPITESQEIRLLLRLARTARD